MASSLEEFFHKLREEITLPVSGLVVAIRYPDQMALLRLREELIIPVASVTPVPPVVPTDDAHPAVAEPPIETPAVPVMSPQRFLRLKQGIVAAAVINPPMRDVRNDQDEPVYSTNSYVHVSELHSADFEFLFETISTRLGITAGDATAAESFRPVTEREDRATVGAGVPATTP